MNWDNLDWNNFSCVDMTRKIRDKMSAELNAMTPEERHLYFERININARQRKLELDRKREKVKGFYELR